VQAIQSRPLLLQAVALLEDSVELSVQLMPLGLEEVQRGSDIRAVQYRQVDDAARVADVTQELYDARVDNL
jgi:hypothetical protein